MRSLVLVVLMGRKIVREENTEEVKEQIRQVKQVRNKNLLSFGDDDDDDDDDDNTACNNGSQNNSFRIVSFRESHGMGKTDNSKVSEESNRAKPIKKEADKEKENAWVQRLKEKIRSKMSEEELREGGEGKSSSSTTKADTERSAEFTTSEDMREKVKNKIREMKKKSKEVNNYAL